MDKTMKKAVERVIATMRENLGQQLTIDDMARVAMFSKFHFSRVFQRVTGISPGRFLSALRLQQAKRLLVSTQSNVADISLQVGYTSIGTFSSRFTRSVGLSPTAYRRLGGYAPILLPDTTISGPDWAFGTVKGSIRPHSDEPQLTFVGLFRDRIPERRPVSCAILDQPGPFTLEKVPPGQWFLLAHSVSLDPSRANRDPSLGTGDELGVGSLGPIIMRRGMVIDNAEVDLKEISDLDPPVLLALLDVRKAALERAAGFERAPAAVA